jgi:tyrosyl-tRNA synthetase
LNNDTLLIDLLIDSNLLTSRADAKRLCDQNAIKIDDEVVNDIFMDIPKGKSFVLKVGKKKFLKVL